MRKVYGSIVVLIMFIICLTLTNCSKNSTDPNENNNKSESDWDLYGSWVGTNFEFISQADTTVKANLSSYGVSFSITINADSSYSSVITFLGQNTNESGTIEVTENQITLTSITGESNTGTYWITQPGVTIMITDEEFDFNQDGTSEPAFLYIDLVKS